MARELGGSTAAAAAAMQRRLMNLFILIRERCGLFVECNYKWQRAGNNAGQGRGGMGGMMDRQTDRKLDIIYITRGITK